MTDRPEPASQRGSPTIAGRYVLLETRAKAAALRAFDAKLDREVMIVFLDARDTPDATARALARLRRLAALEHANVVRVLDAGLHGSRPFAVLLRVHGPTAREWLREPRPREEVVRVFLAAGEGLAAAHAHGLVHGDFNADAVTLGADLHVRVSACGLNELVDPAAALQPPTPDDDRRRFCEALLAALDGASQPAGPSSTSPEKLRRALSRALRKDPRRPAPSMDALLTELRRALPSPRRRVLAASLSAACLISALAFVSGAREDPLCTGALAQLDDAWGEAERRSLEDALRAAERPFAEEAHRRVLNALDRYARRWANKFTEVCEATRVTGRQTERVMDLRMRCLEERRVTLRETVQVVADLDHTALDRAVRLAASLPALDRCDDVEHLQRPLPPPDDPDDAARVKSSRDRLERVHALQRAGAYTRALSATTELAREADAIAYAPLIAEVTLTRGRLLLELADYGGARRDLERSYIAATAHAHESIALKAAATLIALEGERLERFPAGFEWGRLAEALIVSTSHDELDEAEVHEALGHVHEVGGDSERARARYARALALRERNLDPRHPALADSLVALARAQTRRTAYSEAHALLSRARDIYTRTLGSEHPAVADTLIALGDLAQAQGETAEALTRYARALEIRENALGPKHPDLGDALLKVAWGHGASGQFTRATPFIRRALTIKRETLGPRHSGVADAVFRLGVNLEFRGEHEAAERETRHALELFEETLGPRHHKVARALKLLGNIRAARGDYEHALTLGARALAILEERVGRRHPDIIGPLVLIADARSVLGAREEAIEELQRALAVAVENNTPGPQGLIHNNIGAVLVELEQHAAAAEHFTAALELQRSAFGSQHPSLAGALINLGELALASDDAETAEARFREALEIWERALGPEHPELAYAYIGLANVALARRRISEAHAAATTAVRLSSARPFERATAQLVLAKALWRTRDEDKRAEARALAAEARDSFYALGDERNARSASAWLTAHA